MSCQDVKSLRRVKISSDDPSPADVACQDYLKVVLNMHCWCKFDFVPSLFVFLLNPLW